MKNLVLFAALLTCCFSISVHAEADVEFVSQYGGACMTTAVDGNTAYVGMGPKLMIYDLTDPYNTTLLGQPKLFEGSIMDIIISDNYAYLACYNGGLAIIDIADPNNPIVVSQYASVVHGLEKNGQYLFLAAETGLSVLDVSNPAQPVFVSSYNSIEPYFNVTVSGQYAYAVDNILGLDILDISDIYNPFKVGHFTSPYLWNYDVAVNGNVAYLTTINSLITIDISNKALPTYIDSTQLSAGYKITIADNRAFVGAYSGLEMLDLANPAHPVIIGHYNGKYRDVSLYNNYALLSGINTGFHIVDIADINSPSHVYSDELEGYANCLAFKDNYIYSGSINNTFEIFAVAYPAQPEQVTKIPACNGYGIKLAGDYAYLTGFSTLIQVIDISYPWRPNIIATVQDYGGDSIEIYNNYAYITWRFGSEMYIVDISNPAAPKKISTIYFTNPMKFTVYSDTGFLADGGAGLKILNMSNPANPTVIGTYNTDGYAYDVKVRDNIAYLADEEKGLKIFDVSNLSNPVLVNSIETFNAALNIELCGNYAYVIDFGVGVKVLDITNPAAPVVVGNKNTPTRQLNMTSFRSYLATTEELGGLYFYRINPADINRDIKTNFDDFAVIAQNWLSYECNHNPIACIDSDLQNDQAVDFADIQILADHWLN
jgi:hypothetical protein